MKRVLALVSLTVLIMFIAWDSRFHFDAKRIAIKQAHQSDQRNWNLFYTQTHVFEHSSLRYQRDFARMKLLVEPGTLLLSDKATSYFAAAELPVYAMNVHRHQGRWQRLAWERFIDERLFCYQEFQENREKVWDHLSKNPELDYVLVNRDGLTWHRQRDCLAFRSGTLGQELPKIANLIYQGEWLDLYKIN